MKLSPSMFLEACGGDEELAVEVCKIAQSGKMVAAMQCARQGYVPKPDVEREELTPEGHREMVARFEAYDAKRRAEIRPAVEAFLKAEIPEGFDRVLFSEEEAFNSFDKSLLFGESKTLKLYASFKAGGKYEVHSVSKAADYHGKRDAWIKGTRWDF